jgi:hypothetical protein
MDSLFLLKFTALPLLLLTAFSGGDRDANPSAATPRNAGSDPASAQSDAQAAYEAALPALGDMAIFAIGRGEDTLSARPIAENAIKALGQARSLLLSGKAANKPISKGDPFAAFGDAPDEEIETAKELWAISRIKSCATVQIRNCERRYDDLLRVLAGRAGLGRDETPDDRREGEKTTSKYSFPTCDSLRSAGRNADAHLEDFNAVFPAEIVGETSVDKLDLSVADLRSIGSYASCVTGLTPNMPPEIADSTAALYSSKKHGKAAFAALDALAKGNGQDAALARAFAEQMRVYITGPSE